MIEPYFSISKEVFQWGQKAHEQVSLALSQSTKCVVERVEVGTVENENFC